jgi:uncharacterized membrane protein HdeD (DUF308 family)
MKKDWFAFIGVLAIVFGIVTMISNYLDFSNFPLSLRPISMFGLLLFVGGLAGIFYAFR